MDTSSASWGGRHLVAAGRKTGGGTAFIASARPHHTRGISPPPVGSTRFATRARWAVGLGGRDECGPSTGSLFPPSCNKVTRTLSAGLWHGTRANGLWREDLSPHLLKQPRLALSEHVLSALVYKLPTGLRPLRSILLQAARSL